MDAAKAPIETGHFTFGTGRFEKTSAGNAISGLIAFKIHMKIGFFVK